jgi:predicted ABC-type transport system involved in lysophospholipase L1 biosynthesis ATPase subunit
MPGETVVRARAVTKTFGTGRAARTVLRGADLDVSAGELVAVVGRSGSGKSTLLHVLAGLDRADSGAIEVAGARVDGARDRDVTALRARAIGFVFQFFHLVPELTGEENVLLPARVRGTANGAVARGRELIDRLELGEVAAALPHELSGGEQQRFAIARGWSTTRRSCSPTSRSGTSTRRAARWCSRCCGRSPARGGPSRW